MRKNNWLRRWNSRKRSGLGCLFVYATLALVLVARDFERNFWEMQRALRVECSLRCCQKLHKGVLVICIFIVTCAVWC